MIEVGTKVRYIRKDTEEAKATGYYPPIGTIGTVEDIDKYHKMIEVQWLKGTAKGNARWWCYDTDVEIVLD